MQRQNGTTHVSRAVGPMPRPEEVALPILESVSSLLRERYTEDLRDAFPDIAPPIVPTGIIILVQLKTPGTWKKLANGTKFYLPDEAVDSEKARAQTALVRAV